MDKNGNSLTSMYCYKLINFCKSSELNYDGLKNLVNKYYSLNCEYHGRLTIFHYFCANENISIDMLELTLEFGANLNNTGNYNETPFHLFCKNPSITVDMLKLMLEAGANPNIKGRNNLTPFHYLCDNIYTNGEMLKLMLKFDGNPNTKGRDNLTPFLSLCYNRDASVRMLKIMLEGGADPNIVLEYSIFNTLVTFIYYNQHDSADKIKLMLEYGVDVNTTTDLGDTALHFLNKRYRDIEMDEKMTKEKKEEIENIFVEITDVLLKFNADVTLLNLLDKRCEPINEECRKLFILHTDTYVDEIDEAIQPVGCSSTISSLIGQCVFGNAITRIRF